MKVLHVLLGRPQPDTANGVSKSCYYLTRHQCDLGGDIHVLGLSRKCEYDGQVVSERPRIELFRPPGNRFLCSRAFFKRIREIRPDIIHLHSAYIPEFQHMGRWLSRNDIPYVVSPRGAYRALNIGNSFKKRIWLRLIESGLLKNASMLHFLTKAELYDFELLGIKTRGRKTVVPNGIDCQGYRDPLAEKQYVLQRYNLPHDSRVVLFVGRLDIWHKGLDLLIQGFKCVTQESTKCCHLLLAGPDVRGSSAALGRMIDGLGLSHCVHLIGPVYGQDKFRAMAGADLFVIPSRFEGFPNALLEALSVGARCVVSATVGLSEDIINCRAGWVCDLDAAAIGSSMMEAFSALEAPRSIHEISHNSVNLVADKYTWRGAAAALLREYREG